MQEIKACNEDLRVGGYFEFVIYTLIHILQEW